MGLLGGEANHERGPSLAGKASDTMPSSWVISEFPEKLLAVLKVRDE